MKRYEELNAQHLEMQAQLDQDASSIELKEVRAFIEEVRESGHDVPLVAERDKLRNILRYWAAYVYDQTGDYPASQLAPANLQEPEKSSSFLPQLLWWILGISLITGALALYSAFSTTNRTGSSQVPISEEVATSIEALESAASSQTGSLEGLEQEVLAQAESLETLQEAVSAQAGEFAEASGSIGEQSGMIATVEAATLAQTEVLENITQTLEELAQTVATIEATSAATNESNSGNFTQQLVVHDNEAEIVNVREGPSRTQCHWLGVLPTGAFADIIVQTSDTRWFKIDVTSIELPTINGQKDSLSRFIRDTEASELWISSSLVRLLDPVKPDRIQFTDEIPDCALKETGD